MGVETTTAVSAGGGQADLRAKLQVASMILACCALTFQLTFSMGVLALAGVAVSNSSFWTDFESQMESSSLLQNAMGCFIAVVSAACFFTPLILVAFAWFFCLFRAASITAPYDWCALVKIPPWGYIGYSRSLLIAGLLNVFHGVVNYLLCGGDVSEVWGSTGAGFLILATVFVLGLAVLCVRIASLEQELPMDFASPVREEEEELLCKQQLHLA